MYGEVLTQKVCEIQRAHRKSLLIYRQAVLKTPRPQQSHNLRIILTNGTRIRHIEGFLGIKPITPVTNIFDISPNDRVHVISMGIQLKRVNCVVCYVKENLASVEIVLAIKTPGYFSIDENPFINQSFLHQHELTFDVDKYPYKTSIYCLIDENGDIDTSKYILTKI